MVTKNSHSTKITQLFLQKKVQKQVILKCNWRFTLRQKYLPLKDCFDYGHNVKPAVLFSDIKIQCLSSVMYEKFPSSCSRNEYIPHTNFVWAAFVSHLCGSNLSKQYINLGTSQLLISVDFGLLMVMQERNSWKSIYCACDHLNQQKNRETFLGRE